MTVVDLIRRKRDGGRLSPDEIRDLVAQVAGGALPAYQTAALLMAVFFRGLDEAETAALTEAMAASGTRLGLAGLTGPKVDKHGTGGVGDKTSLVVAPLAAACGVIVPMMSGRALGHTGGTVDKLESIPGFRTDLTPVEVRAALDSVGCVVTGQTADIAPADRVLYGLRDLTATIDSVPLIAASILSKKLAEDLDGLLLDVWTGRGAFMKTGADARGLAEILVTLGSRAGVRTEAVITTMDAPLGRAVGNAVEVIESIETLKGRGPADLETLSVEFAARMLVLGGLEAQRDAATERARRALRSGAALERFRLMIEAQGGDAAVVDDYARLPAAPGRRRIRSPRAGFIAALDAELVGRASMTLGGGRDTVDAAIDHGVGVVLLARPGDLVVAGQPVFEVHVRSEARLDEALTLLRTAVVIDEEPVSLPPLVREVVERPAVPLGGVT